MRIFGYVKVASFTTVNILLNGATLGRWVWLEGRVERGVFTNWARRFRYAPKRFVKPTSEQEIVELIRNAGSMRVFGSGHSFNSGVVADETLVSLDDFSGLLWKDVDKKQVAVKGGTRVRDVVALLLEEGLAFRALPSHDAQSIAGILSTDVHGTGRDWGFVNESVVRLKLIDGKGEVHECVPEDDLFKAAVGGIGAVGVISEVVVQGVERFDVEQKVQTRTLASVEEDLDWLLQENEHLSLYVFPFADKCRVNTWNCTDRRRSPLGDLREFVRTSIDALGAAWIGNFIAYTGLLRKVSSLVYGVERGSNLILESNKAFNRTLYHLHQELEFTIPFEDTFEVLRYFIRLYEQMYHLGLPYTLFEVRFTPKRERTLIGAGRGRRCTWIDLVCNDSQGFEQYYAAAENLIKEIGARPHLGKFCETFDEEDLASLHQGSFTTFMTLVEQHDPDRKFANDFTRRLFGRPK
ncbi:MAG TPA: D-arabinono-1,4-lactone oxidase [Rubrobacter sp.]|jgi:FAD/FMN-containing dehydrogenase|nr:D-arabinono-1,4-lactone oxidase [Rubrobacter sp.]